MADEDTVSEMYRIQVSLGKTMVERIDALGDAHFGTGKRSDVISHIIMDYLLRHFEDLVDQADRMDIQVRKRSAKTSGEG